MNQSINLRALQWAYDQNDLGVTAKAVLVTLAMHANDQGYSWPGVERIASTWGMDRETVRRQIEALLGRRMIHRTKKRRGSTGILVSRCDGCGEGDGNLLAPREHMIGARTDPYE